LPIAAVPGAETNLYLSGWKTFKLLSNVETDYLETPHTRDTGKSPPHY